MTRHYIPIPDQTDGAGNTSTNCMVQCMCGDDEHGWSEDETHRLGIGNPKGDTE